VRGPTQVPQVTARYAALSLGATGHVRILPQLSCRSATACLLITVTSLLRHSNTRKGNTQRLAAVTGAIVRPTVCQVPANFPHRSLALDIRWFRRRSGIGTGDSDVSWFSPCPPHNCHITSNRLDTAPWGPPSLLYKRCRISFPGSKRPGRDNHPHYLAPG
jgi:hypothetical protein